VLGGEVIAQGTPAELSARSGIAHWTLPIRRCENFARVVEAQRYRRILRITNARQRNLKNLTVEFPIGAMTCVTGVSGAGKSTLVMEVLYHGISQRCSARGRKNPTPRRSPAGKTSID
jgi:excinuclease ABC subunit A